MAVIVNHASAVAETFRLKANAAEPVRSEADTLTEDRWWFDPKNLGAFGDDSRALRRVRLPISARLVGSTEDAVVCSRDDVH